MAKKLKSKYSKEEIWAKAVALTSQEKTDWEDGVVFVTDKVAFNMRNLIRVLRKNYWGVFDSPKDPNTGVDKTWVPLTESMVEATIKNIDLDTKDINFRAKKPGAIPLTSVVRNIIKNRLDQIGFGEYLDELERTVAIDGTAVWKTYEETVNGKKKMNIKIVDLLNLYTDPLARTMAESSSNIERAIVPLSEFKSMSGWENKDDVSGEVGLSVSSDDRNYANKNGQSKMVEVYERWGLMPKSFITGLVSDDEEYIEGHIVVSGISKNAKCHLIEENKKKDEEGNPIRPYEEVWLTRVPGRWYGRGVAEKLMMLQVWVNQIVNYRKTRAMVTQLGIFKIKQGSGVTPQMVSKLASNGAITVRSMDDIEQFVMQDASPASYKDEEVIQTWAQRVTSAFDVATGESLPASTPATNAVLQAKNADSQFVLIKEGIGMFLQRWIKRQAIPILAKTITQDELVRITGEGDNVEEHDEKIVDQIIFQKLSEAKAKGEFVDPVEVERAKQSFLRRMKLLGKDRFVELKKKLNFADYDVQVYVTNEEIDKSVLAANLMTALQIGSANPMSGIPVREVLKQVFDVMGLDGNLLPEQEPQMMMPQQAQPAPQQGVPNAQNITTQANTI